MDFLLLLLIFASLLQCIETRSCIFNIGRNSKAELEVWPPPQHLKFKPGKNIYLECRLKGSPKLVTNIKWYTPTGSEVLPLLGTNESYFSERRGNDRLALYILSPNENDVGQWVCNSTYRDVIGLKTTFNLIFSDEMSFFDASEVQVFNLFGDFAKLNCTIKSQPSPEIEWWRNGQMISTGGRYEIVDDGLKINGITEDDAGLYECRIYLRELGEVLIKHIRVHTETPGNSPKESNVTEIASLESDRNQFYACDFESSDLCGFIQDLNDNFDWNRHYGETPTIQTGPSTDHTFGINLGHYMYIESSWPQRENNKARLISPLFKGNSSYCVTFWYHMYGQEMGNINVYKNSSLGYEHLLWTISGNQRNHWNQNQTSIETVAEETFQIVFEGVVGPSFTSDAALDDIQIVDRSCDDPT